MRYTYAAPPPPPAPRNRTRCDSLPPGASPLRQLRAAAQATTAFASRDPGLSHSGEMGYPSNTYSYSHCPCLSPQPFAIVAVVVMGMSSEQGHPTASCRIRIPSHPIVSIRRAPAPTGSPSIDHLYPAGVRGSRTSISLGAFCPLQIQALYHVLGHHVKVWLGL